MRPAECLKLVFAVVVLAGCSTAPTVTRSGFLTKYDSLEPVDTNRLRYISSRLHHYSQFIVDPVEVTAPDEDLNQQEREEISRYCREAFIMVIRDRGFPVTQTPGPRTARLRIAITSVQAATWWKKIHPASNALGAGRGGAAMEAEVTDSISGEQIAAVVQAGVGSQFRAFNISTVSDVKSTIDFWAKHATDHVDSAHATR